MAIDIEHADDEQLRVLLWADEEDSRHNHITPAHVASCETCSMRLEELSGSRAIDDETRELLGGYPWDSIPIGGGSPVTQSTEVDRDGDLDFLGPASHPELLGRLGRYEVERVIGKGGMGIVLKAYDTELNRPVAVKVLAKHLAHSGAARQRFARESRAAAAVVHEHVVAIHNVEADDDTPFLVMQYVAGESLQARVDQDGPLDTIEILRIGIQAASGLAAAHEQGLIHRDVKPANILLENSVERALITDFGLARTVDDASLTQTGVIAGTPHYMSPEQANGQPTDHRTDLFSLGAVLYFMATGHPPFRAERAMGVLNRICHDRQKPLWQVADHIPGELSVLVDRLLEKQPAKRFASADVLRLQLTKLLTETQQPSRGLRRRVRRWALRHPKRSIAACMLVVLALTAFVTQSWLPFERDTTTSIKSFDVAEHPELTEHSVRGEAATNLTGASFQGTESLARELAELSERLDKFDDPFAFEANSMDTESPNLQSLHQRLDRLQGIPDFESRNPMENQNETERK